MRDLAQLVRECHALHRAGRFDAAAARCRAVLAIDPDEPNALHLLGLMAYADRRTDEAVDLIRRAAAIAPAAQDVAINLANALRSAGRLEESLAEARRAVGLDPASAQAHAQLAQVLNETGAFAEALDASREAVARDPSLAYAHVGMAVALTGLQRLPAAGTAYQQALKLDPNQPEVLSRFGLLLGNLERFDAALICHRHAIALAPGNPSLHLALAETRFHQGALEAAIAAAREAIRVAPELADAHNVLGACLNAVGRFAEAEAAFREVLRLAPDRAGAYRGLVTVGVHKTTERDRLVTLLQRSDLPVAQRISAGFALGDWLDRAGAYDAAFGHYAEANRLASEQLRVQGEYHDDNSFRDHIDELIAACDPAFFAAARAWGNPSELPVLVVGMPRSGTTLVEQVLATHPKVFAAGERKDLGRLARRLMLENPGKPVAAWDPTGARRHADAYVEQLQALGGGALRVTDKMPDNIFPLGVIAALLPRAHVVLCQRDLRDVCLSCFFQYFVEGHAYTYDLRDCARRAVQVERLMAHWRAVLPTPVHVVRYEAMVAEPEAESRRLVEFVGLPWDPACLEFHRTDRTILTASSWQARQPIYARSVGRWRNYAAHLGPMLEILGPRAEPVAPR